MTQTEKYNGWTNYETWNVALWFDNDSSQYWQERAQEIYEEAEAETAFTKEESAALTLADEMKDSFEENCPINDASPYMDLLNSAMSEINWYEIAENYIKEVGEE